MQSETFQKTLITFRRVILPPRGEYGPAFEVEAMINGKPVARGWSKAEAFTAAKATIGQAD